MPDFNLQKQDLPLWKGGSGNLTIHVTGAQLNQPLAPSDSDLISVEFGAGGDPFLFGADQSIKLGISAGTTLKLLPLWPSSDQQRLATLANYGLDQYFNDHPNDLVLALIIGAQADLSLAGSFRYAVLQINSTLDAGGRAGYAHLRAYPASQPVQPMITDFFQNLKLPAHITTPPQPGEVITFDYGGYLRLGVNLAAGYEMKGAPRLDIGQLQLSEHYKLSVLGKLALNASLAGEFSVEVRAATDSNGQPLPGWARVVVRKKRDSQFKIAADVNALAQGSLKGLPGSGREFLGAMLGVNVKNWLNVVARVRELSDLDKLKGELDALAKDFLGQWIGRAFDELSQTEFGEFLNNKVHPVIASYENLDNSAITLFDQYFDKLNILEDKLNELIALTSWDRLQGEVDEHLWRIVQQLTGGDPLGWILGKIKVRDKNGNVVTIPTLPKLKELATQTLDLLREDGHIAIRGLIKLAKSEFPLDGFLQKLAQVDTVPELKAIASQRLGAFVERLTGQAVNALSNSELSATITRVHRLLDAVANFEEKLYGKLKEAAEHSASFQLHAEYTRADHRDALVDLMLNLQTERGRELMRAAGHGDFQDALSVYDAGVVRLNHGLLTHRISKQSSFNINVIGWHSGWHYQGMDLVLVQTEQQIEAAENGRLNVFTTIDLTKEKERKSNRTGERMYTNFLLRFLGEAHGVLKFDERNQQYLIDTLTGMAARYRLSFDDARTTRDELDYYLSFAAEFGLAAQGATLSQVLPLLPHQPGDDNNFGQVSVEYEARYTEAGLRKLFSTPFDAAAENKVRQVMRQVVLANYARDAGLAAVGWCYWTPGVYDLWKQGQADFTNVISAREFKPISKSPFAQLAAPNKAVLPPEQIRLLSTLFFIEDRMIAGMRQLASLIKAGQMIGPHDFENALKDIGDALKSFDDFDEGVNTVFAVFDRLIQAQTPAGEARLSSMTLVSEAGNQHFTRRFIAQPQDLPETAALAGSVSG
ncbi:MAG: hypothetical protein U0Z53_18875 [Blastocatellia bacterium]